MRRNLITFALLCAVASIPAGAAMAQNLAPQPASPPAPPSGGEAASSVAVVAPTAAAPVPTQIGEEGTGTVHVLRRGAMVGAVISYWMREGDSKICKISNGSLQAFKAPAGVHEYVVHSERKDGLRMEIEPGEDYYVVVTLVIGVVVAVPNLAPISAEDFKKLAGNRKEKACDV